MNLKMFGSMGLAICALGYLLLILLMYLNKKRLGDTQNKVFSVLLLLTILLTFSEMGYVYGLSVIDARPKLTETLCRIYILGNLVWINLLMFYMMTLLEKNNDKEKEKKYNLVTAILLIVLVVIIASISLTLPIDYSSSKSGLYNFSGPATAVVYIDGILLFMAMCLALIIKNKNIPVKQKKPIYFSFITFVIFITVQLVFEYDYNTISFIFAFMIATLYFTIESQDSRLIEELEASKEASAIADKAKTEFLLNMSHEIRTPMSTILGFSEILANEEPLDEQTAKEDTESIHEASNMLMDLIHAILDISALESNKEIVLNENYYTKNLIFDLEQDILNLINPDIEYKTVVNNIPKKLNGDARKLHKIIINILNYFIIATSRGKITLTIDSKKIENLDYELIFNINDNNCGIKNEDFEIQFNDFVKLGDNKSNSIDNDELRLIIAKRYVELLGGKITFKNEKNICNCNISIVQTLVADNEYDSVDMEASREKTNDEVHENKKEFIDEKDNYEQKETKEDNINNDNEIVTSKNILIFDSNKINHKIINRLLKEYKFNIFSAYSIEDLENRVRFKKYDLILIDSSLFDEKLEEIIKKYNVNTKIIEMGEEKMEKQRDYISDIIYKPISKESMDNIVLNYLSGKDVK